MDETFVLDTKLVNSIEQDVEDAYGLLLSDVVMSNVVTLGRESQLNIKQLCLTWLTACLSTDLTHHTHHVTRNGATSRLKSVPRVNMFADHCMWEDFSSYASHVVPRLDEEMNHSHGRDTRKMLSPIATRANSLATSPAVSRQSSVKHMSPSKLLDINHPGAHSTAEIRSVTVLFIKIGIVNMSLCHDEYNEAPQISTSVASNVFCQRTSMEVAADHELLAQLQSSFECIASAMDVYGGQMRQFIVDDKGDSFASSLNIVF
jgi:hypothetical protein